MPASIRFLRKNMIALALVFIIPAPGNAQTPKPPMDRMEQIALTQNIVRRFLGTMDDFNALSDKYKSDRRARKNNTMMGLSNIFRHQAARAEMERALNKHGFSNLPDWMATARTVMITYGFVKSRQTPKQVSRKMQDTIDKIKNNPNLSEQQRAMILQSFGPALASVRQMQPSPANYAVVKSMQAEIAAKMDRRRHQR